MNAPTASSWWRPDRHQDRRPLLMARNRITAAVRRWFADRDFVEVETAALQVSPGNEAHLHAFATEALELTGQSATRYMRTSPEFACKALLAAGEERIFDFARVWRNRERGVLHHPEFTMLEWYRTAAPYEELMEDCHALLILAAETAGTGQLRFRGRICDPLAAPERVTVAQAIERHAGIDLLSTMDSGGETDRPALAAGARAAGIRVADDDSWADIFSRILVEKVEPHLGSHGYPTLLYDYPVEFAALSKPNADGQTAQRFEFYIAGIELGNCYSELADWKLQEKRLADEAALRAASDRISHPSDTGFVDSLKKGLSDCAGIAIGIERLAMIFTNTKSITGLKLITVTD
ncbi:MAG: EF-P lysine aminoacylase GenX [Caulobacteraceae bacterium]|nr:EF-P lysine aminoacylase GenX [Caulobacteraceae bacterium]